MDFRAKKENPNPLEKASLISKLFFLWIVPLFKEGFKKDLTTDDMYNVPREDVSHKLGNQLGQVWDKLCTKARKNGETPGYHKAIIEIFGRQYIFLGIALLIDECVIRVAQPIFLRLLIRSFKDHTVTPTDQYFYAAGVCLTALLHSLIIHPLSFEILHMGMKCRISTCSLIYRKTMRLSREAQENTTVGQLINLLSNDVNRFDMNLMFIPYLIIGPIQTLIFMYFLWEELGVSCLAGIGFVFLLMPLQYYIGTLSRMLRSKIATKADERGRVMNEIIMAIRVIKMYAWEKPFSSLIERIRRDEVKVLRQRAYLRSFYFSLSLSSKKFVPYLTFLAYVLFGHSLSADKIFYAVTIFDVVIINMISTLPSAAAGCGELVVAVKRIEEFLLHEEQRLNNNVEVLSIDSGRVSDEDEKANQPYVRMQNVTATWSGDKFNLQEVNMNLTGNKLVMIVGCVGGGKSSILQALLQELPISSGKCYMKGKLAYSCQDPWIFSGTVRQNILFGKEYDEELYEMIISVCALESDFMQLPQRDYTIVGERGITLSGGQKARVNLARSLYQQADIYLLDDPLSAVDSRVSRHIFDKCIKKYLSGSLRILVTHQLQYLPQTDHVIVMDKGCVLDQGTYEELVERGVDFVSLITSEADQVNLYRKASITKRETMESEIKKEEETHESQVEKMASGSVSLKTYWEYYRSGDSLCGMILVFSGFVVSQILYTFSDYWLALWTNYEELQAVCPGKNDTGSELFLWQNDTGSEPFLRQNETEFESGILNNNVTETESALSLASRLIHDPLAVSELDAKCEQLVNPGKYYHIIVYSVLVLVIAVATNVNCTYFFRYCMRISVNVHNKMFGSLVRAPVKFYDENPSGRMMNRFTKDLCSMDESLPSACYDVITILLVMLGVIFVVILSNLYVIVPSTFLVLSLWIIRRYYIQTARDVKRIEAITRSPLFTHMTASIQGLTTIRALRTQRILTQQFDGHQDIHSAAWFLFISSNRWFGIWLEMISVTFLAIVTFSFLFFSTTSGYVGLAISSVLSVTFKFQWGMRQSAEMENLMTSVERCLEYVKVQPEAQLDSEPKLKPHETWPSGGEIKFEKVTLAYDDKEVLQGLSFHILPMEKIGIVGRTGAGKSSIITALFRLTEPSGNIYIDGVRIQDIGLHDLRRSISIIPQDPVLFSGTVRYNLDPFEQFKDDELWQVLKEVHLHEAVEALDSKVNDGGTNFSLGQRQLVCLARAILRKNKIIVMDEATANVDPGTDAFIQTTIRDKFAECTIITIAHRLHSVMDCDKILVLESGCLQEYDHPHILLQNPDSILSSMARHTGKSSHMHLKRSASMAYKTKFQASI